MSGERRHLRAVAILCWSLAAACEIGTERRFTIVPGPNAPSGPTAEPLIWDERAELALWVDNPATRGPVPIAIAGDGRDAFIRIDKRRDADGWVLRGPDLDRTEVVHALLVRYRWTPDPAVSPTAVRTFHLRAIFDALNPPFPPDQPIASRSLPPAEQWTDAELRPFGTPLSIRFVYLHQFSNNPGVFEIDRMQLLR